jgi:hypothetical protein
MNRRKNNLCILGMRHTFHKIIVNMTSTFLSWEPPNRINLWHTLYWIHLFELLREEMVIVHKVKCVVFTNYLHCHLSYSNRVSLGNKRPEIEGNSTRYAANKLHLDHCSVQTPWKKEESFANGRRIIKINDFIVVGKLIQCYGNGFMLLYVTWQSF